ncbi:Fanconi anemia group I protein-like isoform X3 [Hydractinia symbiolongicarpus]|uniref:Fanconi anemia group I protein-like isoform X3 n=1 Tax=Hydractinia symbiolongicarpus TaxID=13093 RepID=UPI00254DBBD3|nr:Fanconi anemia group I protein-like isoform X3 [Hydractinia symbiolongicarpus]
MSKELLLSICDGNKKNAEKAIASLKFSKVIEILSDQIIDGTDQAVILLRFICKGLEEDEKKHQKKNKIVKRVFHLLNSKDIINKVTSELVGYILPELDDISTKEQTELIDFILDKIKAGVVSNGKSLEVFSKLITSLSYLTAVPVKEEGIDTTMSGSEYKQSILQKLCDQVWIPSTVMLLATMFRDIQMSNDELKMVIKKTLNMFYDVPLQEIPPLVYQTLLLSSKGYKREVLDGIASFCFHKAKEIEENEQTSSLLVDDNELLNLKSVEGTVLLHAIFAVKQDQDLGKEFIKYIKVESLHSPEKILSPFTLALALAMTQIHRLEEQLFDFLKSFILKCFKDDEREKQSKWIRDLFPASPKIEEAILNTSRNSKFGWDHMTQGLINLSFILIECYVPKSTDLLTNDITPQQRACNLGTKMIHHVFTHQEIVRENVLQRLLDAIITKATQNVQHYLDLLTSVIASVPQIVIDCLQKFREVFDYLSMLNLSTAEGLLRAILPLMKVSMSIKDSLMLILRKSMFSKQVEARKIAVTGFLLILKHFKIDTDGRSICLSSQLALSQSFSCSQVNVSSQARYNTGANEALCIEIISSLRKSLTQSAEIRTQLYEGIYEVSCKNPKLTLAILELLFQQFSKYYKVSSDVLPPIKLQDCISQNNSDEVQIIEPLAHLLCALQLCTKNCGKLLNEEEEEERDENLSRLHDKIENILLSLSERMVKAELEDFELVLMEYHYMKCENISIECGEVIWKLFQRHQKLQNLLKEKANSGKKGKSSASKSSPKTMFSFKCLTSMIFDILCNTEPAAEPGLNVLRQSVELVKFLTASAHIKLVQLLDSRYCDGAGGKNLEHLFRQCLKLSRSFLQHINGDCVLSDDVLKRNKGRKLGNLCLDGLNQIIGFVCNHHPEQLQSLLESLDFTPDIVTQNDVITEGSLVFRVIRRLQRLSLKIMASPDEDLGMREAQVILSMLAYLIPHLTLQTEMQPVYLWFHRLAAEQTIDDVLLTKTIVAKLLSLHYRCKSNNTAISKLAQDIHSQVGDIDEDIEVENRGHFKIVTEKTATPTIFYLLLQHMEKVLDEVDWALGKLKSLPYSESTDSNESVDNRENYETNISQLLIGVVLSLHELTQSAFPLGICADIITKVVTKLYTTLGNFTKYLLSLYTQKKGNVVPKFERLVKLTGSHLAQQVYAMITFMQSIQSQALQDQTMNGKNKAKDRKKANIAGKNRALKESRSIPNLIYSIEQFERYLIQLSKKSKIDFMENIKRSTSRDFRINTASLEAALHELSDDESENDEASIETETSEVLDLTKDDPPPSKRPKLTSGRKPLISKNT